MNWLRVLVMDLALRVDAMAFRLLAVDLDSDITWRDRLRWWIEDWSMRVWAMAYSGSEQELVDALQFDFEYLSLRQREHVRASTWSVEIYRGAR